MITLEQAKKALAVAEEKAKGFGVPVSTAVVDEYGVLIAFSKMDGALVVSPEFAFHKAYTSATLQMPSGAVAEYAYEGKPYYSVNTAFKGKYLLIAGGVPVQQGGKVVGAVGVGGSKNVTEDLECAKAAAAVLTK
ncbi:MAG TPA: heme-binding protein [Patescibacteria group bacterium]|nr:heme-binding protein [Patescibacteria group bacterium]